MDATSSRDFCDHNGGDGWGSIGPLSLSLGPGVSSPETDHLRGCNYSVASSLGPQLSSSLPNAIGPSNVPGVSLFNMGSLFPFLSSPPPPLSLSPPSSSYGNTQSPADGIETNRLQTMTEKCLSGSECYAGSSLS